MPKKPPTNEPKGPALTPDEARLQLGYAVKRGRDLQQLKPLPKERYDVWRHTSFDTLKAACGEMSKLLYDFVGQGQVPLGTVSDAYAEPQRRMDLERQIRVLEAVIDDGLPVATMETNQAEDFWARLHPTVVQVSKPRFDSGHYADAVEAALKELNQRVKDHVRRKTGKELDGAGLMTTAFSPNNPIITLADLSTEDGKNMQQGYMQIFAGAMTGIRNPKAHSNVVIDEQRAIHYLHLASLLHHVFDERL